MPSASPAAATVEVSPAGGALAWATWRRAVLLVFVLTAARLVHAAWLSPWELVGDEAYYWVQGHHLDWGYTEKGPLLPWLIEGCCRVFGDTERAVRLPAILSFALAAWGVGRLGIAASRGDERVGFFTAVLFCLLPGFQANAHISTQDSELIPLWVALTAVGLRLFRRWEAGAGTWGEWLLLWALLGVGFLLKQSVFLFLPGMALYWLFRRRALPLRPVFFAQQIAGVAVLLAVSSPMLLWNATHGWPMLAHTLGHLGAGGDQEGKINAGNPLTWEASTIGSFLGVFGPTAALMVWASVRAWRARRDRPELWPAQLWLICSAWFTTAFFVLLSLKKPIVPTWPIPNMAPACVLVAQLAVERLGAARPDHRFRGLWRAGVVYGLCSMLLLAFPTVLRFVPVYGPKLEQKVLARLAGHRQRFARVDAILATIQIPDGRPPLPVARNYQEASLATFYLHGHPPVATSGNYTGNRPSNFDHWAQTDLSDPAQRGRTLVFMLAGKNNTLEDPGRLEAAFEFDRVRPSPDPAYFIVEGYNGPRGRVAAGRMTEGAQ